MLFTIDSLASRAYSVDWGNTKDPPNPNPIDAIIMIIKCDFFMVYGVLIMSRIDPAMPAC